ncbi:universal stress protein [Altererythrobacter sp. KTW20L]|uniref:universal stress protein n=1 Tax=Altererythrobacter sp. KTW20L TaxID=2942210 RepID=UPI0020BF15AA|nr:universal stress protein [Altererythrobacter sp. KTW20L]MCL6252094.1 universal stress protein [Altererythrobacter sp. KTW20L]
MTTIPLTRTALLYAPVETFNLERGPAAYALDLCAGHGMALTAMLLNTDNANPFSASSRTREQMATASDKLDQLKFDNIAAMESACAARSLDLSVIARLDHSRGFFRFVNDRARLHDLVICSSSKEGMLSERLVCEGLLFDAGRPLLLVPHGHAGGYSARKIAVAWDNSRGAARALGDALALLPGIEEVVFLVIGDEKSIDTGIAPEDLCASVARHGIKATVEHRSKGSRWIGDALQEEARDAGADMLVMGAHGHSRLREFLLGGATLDVLNVLRLPVLMAN